MYRNPFWGFSNIDKKEKFSLVIWQINLVIFLVQSAKFAPLLRAHHADQNYVGQIQLYTTT
jgi:hypothetical protein